jgi:pilus assembly protein Flp/PilA
MVRGAPFNLASVFEGADAVLALQQWGFDMRNFIKSFIRDESGAAAAEYALILAIVGAGIALAASNLGKAISSAINTAQGQI